MAVIGHWLGAFPVCFFVPEASATLLCKLSMLSDALAGLFVLLKIETATVFAWYQATPYPSTMKTISDWKASGEWLTSGPVADQSPGEKDFEGYSALWPLYLNVPYSHSVEFMAILGVFIAAYMRVFYRISASYALGIMFAITSHPFMDMFFHDATLRMGNRAVTRCCIHFWQTPWMGGPSFVLEVTMAYFGYRLWMSTREPIDSKTETASNIVYYKKQFWQLALTHNMTSFYVMSPFMIWAFNKWVPNLQAFTPYAYWSFVLFTLTIWSWTFALYPVYKLEKLTACKTSAKAREAEWYMQAP